LVCSFALTLAIDYVGIMDKDVRFGVGHVGGVSENRNGCVRVANFSGLKASDTILHSNMKAENVVMITVDQIQA